MEMRTSTFSFLFQDDEPDDFWNVFGGYPEESIKVCFKL